MARSSCAAPHGDRHAEAMLAEQFVGLADALVGDDDVGDLLDRLVQAGVSVLGASAAGLLLLNADGRLQLAASTSEESRLLELLQLQAVEGPCLDAAATGTAVVVDGLAEQAERWPRFAEGAGLVGFRSVCAVPLRLRAEVLGSLNLFFTGRGVDAHEQKIAQALADVAAIGMVQQRSLQRASGLAEQLQTALSSRIAIEQTKGMIAEHCGLSLDDAYLLLRSYARNGNHKLARVAQDVAQGRLSLDDVVDGAVRTHR